jgi:plastocyanin
MCAAAILCLTAIGAQEPSGEITGKIALSKAGAKKVRPQRYPHQAGSAATRAPSSPCLVYIEQVAGDFSPTSAKMIQRGIEYVPRVLPVVAGSTVEFPNEDEVYHNVYSFSSAKKFDLGRFTTGESRSVTFDKRGLVKVYCEIHENMRGFIHVLQNPHFSLCDERGEYVLRDVPPGRYILKAWQEDAGEAAAEVVVEPGKPTRADFELSRREGAPSGSDVTLCGCVE